MVSIGLAKTTSVGLTKMVSDELDNVTSVGSAISEVYIGMVSLGKEVGEGIATTKLGV